MKHREFVYAGEPGPELAGQEYAAFLMNVQKAILFSLERRKLLTPSQRQRCLEELEKGHIWQRPPPPGKGCTHEPI